VQGVVNGASFISDVQTRMYSLGLANYNTLDLSAQGIQIWYEPPTANAVEFSLSLCSAPSAGRRRLQNPGWVSTTSHHQTQQSGTVDVSAYSDTMTMSALVRINNVDQPSGTLAAFVGTVPRGIQNTPTTSPFGPYAGKAIYQFSIYANLSGELVTFKFFDGVVTWDLSPTYTLTINVNEGSLNAPFVLIASSASFPPPSIVSGTSQPFPPPFPPAFQTSCGGSWDSAIIGHLKQAAATVLSVTAATVSPYLA
jgi:hypothetical protein